MSLRAFHLFFVGLSVILSAFVAAWAFSQFQAAGDASYLAAAAGSLGAGAALMVYGLKAKQKLGRL